MFPSALLLLSANILLAPQTAAHPLGVHINGAKAVDSVASGTASKAQLIIDGYDFSEYPTADVPPPINTTWNQFYGIDTINLPIPVALPYNSIEEPPCPTTNSSCHWACYNCTSPNDAIACPNHRTWALSYDDGPSLDTLPLLAALDARGAKATFCVVGSRVLAHPRILRQAYDAGHQICAHTWSHRFLTSQTNEQIVAEFEWAIKIIQQVTGARPAYARPPFGDIDDRVRAVLAKMGMKPLIWNRDTFDWNLGNPNSGYQTQWVTGNFTQWISTANTIPVGFMSLEHDLYPQSAAQALPALSLVAAANYTMQTYATCSNTQPYLSVVAVPIPPMPPTYPQTLSVQVPSLPTQRPYGGQSAAQSSLRRSSYLQTALAVLAVAFLSLSL